MYNRKESSLTTYSCIRSKLTFFKEIIMFSFKNGRNNGRKYLTLVPVDECKDTLKRMKNYRVKIEILLDQ